MSLIVAPPWMDYALRLPAFTPASLSSLLAWYQAVDVDATLVKATQPTLTNGGFDSDTSGWSPVNATLTRETTDPIEGAGNLRVTRNGGFCSATQSNQIVGNRYKLARWWGRAGTAAYVRALTTQISAASWTLTEDEEYTAASTNLSLYASCALDGEYGEFDGLEGFENLTRVRWNPNAGSLGGYLSQGTATQQFWSGTLGGRGCVIGADDNANSSLAASAWRCLHDGTGCTVVFSFYPTANGVLLDSRRTRAAGRAGIQINGGPSGVLVQVDNNVAVAVVEIAYSGTVVPSAWNHAVFRMSTAAGYSLRVNGTEVASGSLLDTPYAGDSYRTPAIFGLSGGTPVDPFAGGMDQWAAFSSYLSDADVAKVEAFFA